MHPLARLIGAAVAALSVVVPPAAAIRDFITAHRGAEFSAGGIPATTAAAG